MFAFQDSSEQFQPALPGNVCCDILILGVSSVGTAQKQPVFLRGFLCPKSLKIMLTVKLKSALSGAPSVPPNRAAQGCQRYYTALLKLAVRWKYCPGVHDFIAVKKKIWLSDLIIPPHAQLSGKGKSNAGLCGPRNPGKGICGGQKKSQKQNLDKVGRAGLTFHLHSTDTLSENWTVYIPMILCDWHND